MENLEIYKSIFNFCAESILVSDKFGNIVLINNKASLLFGYSIDEMTKIKIEDLIPMRFKGKHPELRESFIENPVPRSMGVGRNLFAKKKNGVEFPVELSLSHFKDENEILIMSFIIDISERVSQEKDVTESHLEVLNLSIEMAKLNSRLETRVEERTEELAIAVKKLAENKKELILLLEKEKGLNELKSRFVTTASHEFRTPLATILTSISLLGKYKREDEQENRERHINRIKSTVVNLTQILSDFLSIDKLEEGHVKNNPSEMNLKTFFEDLKEEMNTFLKFGQEILIDYNSEIDIIFLDGHLLKNALINLVSNAIKYSNEEKKITIKIDLNDGILKIDVIDNGIGIPEEDQPYLFDRFYRATNAVNIQGTGLGMSIVKRYVDILNGTIDFISEKDKGSTFTIELPILG
ncbi:MAG: PAS domain-containing sensor histidine kinase [Candidatus Kapabacteria bacterium]|nr:PAS domain-containing sensor histidine kinase [Candidatus Kapabacteria bacterium]